MASTQYPLIDLVMNDEVARYVGVLERRVLMLTMDNLKLRTLLELLTDDSWDDETYPDDVQELQRIATDALVRRLGVSGSEAAAIVAERWSRHNPPAADPSTATYLVGPEPKSRRSAVIPIAEQVRSEPSGYDVEKHLMGLKKAATNRDAQRDQI